MKPKIAFVVQRVGKEVNGGAEQHCLQIATHMQKYWDVTILTTCAIDYMSWKNEYQSGESSIDGVRVLRFEVDQPRNITEFNQLSENFFLRNCNVSLEESEEWMKMAGPFSSTFLEYLKEHKNEYTRFIFFTYLYASTYFGLPIVQEKAHLVPTAHDEWPLRLPLWDTWFGLPQSFIFNTEEEKLLLEKRFPHLSFPGTVAGVGMEPVQRMSVPSLQINYPYILYVGRIDYNKGCDELFEFFREYKKRHPGALKLLLVGKAMMPLPQDRDIVSLGFVSDEEKYYYTQHTACLVNPSPFESLSMVILEAWQRGTPTLVTEKSEVMVAQTKRSNGGLWYHSYEDFECALDYILNHRDMAKDASQFVKEQYNWQTIEQKYLDLLPSSHVS